MFDRVKEAKDKWKNAQEDEETKISKYSNEMDSYVGGGRITDTLSKSEIEALIDRKITERLVDTPILDYDNKVNIASYTSDTNQYTVPKNGIIQIFGYASNGYMYIKINSLSVACIQACDGTERSFSTIVNKNDKINFLAVSWNTEGAYYIPYK